MRSLYMFLICILVFCWASPALAAGPEPSPAAATPEVQPEPEASASSTPFVLQIDNEHTFDGMDRPYCDGYMPAIEENGAHIVLPLLAPEDGPGQVRVQVDLGDPQTAPFVFDNYDRTLTAEEQATTDGRTARIFLMDLTVPLVEDAAPGRYPVYFQCESSSSDTAQMFTVYVTIEESAPPATPEPQEPDPGTDPGTDTGFSGGGGGGGTVSEPSPSAEPTPALQPKLMVTGYSVSASPAMAGEPFSITFTLQNTSDTGAVRNLLVQADADDAGVAAAGGANSFYYKAIAPGETIQITTQMLASDTVEPGIKKIQIHSGYDDSEGTAYTTDDSLPVQVAQPVRFVVDEPAIPAEVHAGETMNLSISVMNMGRAPVRNVLADLEAPGLTAQNSLFLGNLDSGTSQQGTMYVFVGALDGDDAASRYADTRGTLRVTCEDEFGKTYEELHEFTLSIAPPVFSQTEPPEEEPQEENTWWISAVAGGAILAVVLAVFLLRARKRRLEEESEDEDF